MTSVLCPPLHIATPSINTPPSTPSDTTACSLPSTQPTSSASNASSSTSASTRSHKKRARFADQILGHDIITFQNDQPPRKRSMPCPQSATVENLHDPLHLADPTLIGRGMYNSFIDAAFTQRENGEMARYEQLLDQFEPLLSFHQNSAQPAPDPQASIRRIRAWLNALGSMVSKLDRTHTTLVLKVISLPWAVLDDEFRNEYSNFVVGLVSARTEWVQVVLQKIVQGFQYRSVILGNRFAVSDEVNRKLIYHRLHALLQTIFKLVPTLPSTLWPILDNHFPKKRDHRDGHVCYITNLLKIASYCPELCEQILQLCIDRCVKIDVEIQVEVEEWEDDEGRLEEAIFGKSLDDPFEKPWTNDDEADENPESDDEAVDMELETVSSFNGDDENENSRDDVDQNDASAPPPPASVKKVKELAAKLDAMMRCIFDHLHRVCLGNDYKLPTVNSAQVDSTPRLLSTPSATHVVASSTPLPLDPRKQMNKELMFDVLMSAFESSILRTRRTRHVQFLMFWYASLQPSFTDSLLASLVDLALYSCRDQSIPIVTRLAAVGYIASLVSRAKFIDKSTTRHVVSLLCARLEVDLASYSSGVPEQGSSQSNALWYSIAQAVLYIFCFRWKDLLLCEDEVEDDRLDGFGSKHACGKKWLNGLKVVEKAISSPLNPLKVCASTVVMQFAKVAHVTSFLYCYNIIRRNNDRSRLISHKAPSDASNPLSSSLSIATNQDVKGSTVTAKPKKVAAGDDGKLGSGTEDERKAHEILSETKMDSFFPFDPLRLPLSSCFVDHLYQAWEGPEHDDDQEEEVGACA